MIDGSGSARFVADVAVRQGRIAQVGNLAGAEAARTIDVAGLIVAPGLIDVHNHSDGWLLKTPHLTPKTLQGFTTEIIMADGISYAPASPENIREWLFYLRSLNALRMDECGAYATVDEYLEQIAGRNVQNVAAHLPYANLRALARGFGPGKVDDYQAREIRAGIRRGMAEGAVGLSTGLDYIAECYADTDELVDACSVMAEFNGLYVTHVRYKIGLLPALKEAVEIGRRAGVGVHISHLKGSSEREVEQVLEYIDTVARHEVAFSFDVYPYQPGSTMLNFLLPYEVWNQGPLAVLSAMQRPEARRRFAEGLKAYKLNLDNIHLAWLPSRENAHHQGKFLSDYVAEVGRPAEEALYDLLIEERLAALLVFNEGEDQLVQPMLQHDLCMLGTDGIYFPDGAVHPRMYGSVGRWLGRAVRDWKLFSLEEAVYKASGFAAQRFRLPEVGAVRAGAWADLMVFDPATIADRATYENPHQPTVGVRHVIVSGVPIVGDGQPAPTEELGERLPGRVVRTAQG